MGEYIIERGVLKRYGGPGGHVVVPEGVTEIGEEAFAHSPAVTSVTLPGTVAGIGRLAFGGCRSLVCIDLPEGLRRIGEQAFYGCEGLRALRLPEGLRRIGAGAFFQCEALEEIVLPDSVTVLGGAVFRCCRGLRSAVLPKRLTAIPALCFEGCYSLRSVVPPEAYTSIGVGAFENCRRLEGLCLPKSLRSIERDAFSQCTSLSDIELPERLTTIGGEAFGCCRALRAVRVPDSVRKCAANAFAGCSDTTILHADGQDITILYEGSPESWCLEMETLCGARLAGGSRVHLYVQRSCEHITLPASVVWVSAEDLREALIERDGQPDEEDEEDLTRLEVCDRALLEQLLQTGLWPWLLCCEENADRILADIGLAEAALRGGEERFDRLSAYARREARTEGLALLLEARHRQGPPEEEWSL